MSDNKCLCCDTEFTFHEFCENDCDTFYCSNKECRAEYYFLDGQLLMGHDDRCPNDRVSNETNEETNEQEMYPDGSRDSDLDSNTDYFDSGNDTEENEEEND